MPDEPQPTALVPDCAARACRQVASLGMTTFSPADDLALALDLADAADAISLPRFGANDLQVSAKPDMTPVSDADLAVERSIRDMLAGRRPRDRVLGEEFGLGEKVEAPGGLGDGAADDPDSAAGDPEGVGFAGRTWVVDPIDGTKNFVRGVPIWATLIALLVDGHPILGVVSAPALARRWWGGTELGAHTRFSDQPPRPCQVSAVGEIDDASLSLAQLNSWAAAGRGEQMAALSRRCWRTRGYGDFYSYMLVAEGAVDIAAEPELSLWDLAALEPIVIAAGGSFTTVDGQAIDAHATSAAATNRRLHDAVITALRPA